MLLSARAEPFLKWAGGKQALVGELLPRFPERVDRFLEPFVGGGAVFFALRPARAVLSDANTWLIDTYLAIREDHTRVVSTLAALDNTQDTFLRVRAQDPRELPLHARAAHFVFLNKTCFRGLYRVNAEGRFNVPYGKYQRRTHDPATLAAVAAALANVELRACDFEETLADARAGDFVYLDPPYWKAGGTADFARYTAAQFRASDHQRLANACRDLDRRGVHFMVSNSDVEPVHELYRGLRIERIAARREICLDRARRDTTELLIRNF